MKPSKEAALAWLAEKRESAQLGLAAAQAGLADIKIHRENFLSGGGDPKLLRELSAQSEMWLAKNAHELAVLEHLERLVLAGWDAH